jgi:DNA-binding LytR/AlgR family response regulator
MVKLRIEEGHQGIDILLTTAERDEQVEALMARIVDPLAGTITVLDDKGNSILLTEDRIISISADNKRLKVVSEDGSYRMRSSLLEIEGRLNPSSFLRISRYEIINLHKVRRFDFSIAGTLRIEMRDGSETWASRRYIQTIRSRLQGKG